MRSKPERLTQPVQRRVFFNGCPSGICPNGCGWAAAVILAFGLWLSAFAAMAQENHTPVVRFDTRRIAVDGIDIQVEVAMTQQQRQQGLMYREHLAGDHTLHSTHAPDRKRRPHRIALAGHVCPGDESGVVP